MIKVKICGLQTISDIDLVNFYKPDYAGFILATGRRRSLTQEVFLQLRERLIPEVSAVGVFVNQSIPFIMEMLDKGNLQVVQLHGSENNDFVRALREESRKRGRMPLILKAFSIVEKEDVERAERTEADYPLMDAGAGGSGKQFDWSLLQEVKRPYFLAGGLQPENVEVAVQRLHPFAVDTSSGVEGANGKSKERLEAFMKQCR